MTRETRSRRQRLVPSRTINVRHITKRELELGKLLYRDDGLARPRRRSDCISGPRPCPYVACKYSLFLDVTGRHRSSITLNFPDLEPDEMTESCALDVADRGGATMEQVGALMNLTRERVRQIEVKAKDKAATALLKFVGGAG